MGLGASFCPNKGAVNKMIQGKPRRCNQTRWWMKSSVIRRWLLIACCCGLILPVYYVAGLSPFAASLLFPCGLSNAHAKGMLLLWDCRIRPSKSRYSCWDVFQHYLVDNVRWYGIKKTPKKPLNIRYYWSHTFWERIFFVSPWQAVDWYCAWSQSWAGNSSGFECQMEQRWTYCPDLVYVWPLSLT